MRGSDWDKLVEISQNMREELIRTGTVVDVDTDYQVGMPELRISPDRARAADLGVSVEDISTTLNALVAGLRIGKYTSGARRVDVRLRLLAEQRSRPEDLARLRVRSSRGEMIPLSAVTTLEERPALQAVTRRDRERAITIFGNVAPGHTQSEALAAAAQLATTMPDRLPPGAGRRQRDLQGVDGQPGLRPGAGDHRRVHDPRLAVQLAAAPDHHPHGAADIGGGGDRGAVASGASRSTSSA